MFEILYITPHSLKGGDLRQPIWIPIEAILDRVISYASFEDQASKLRLVCRQFEASALKQLEVKLLDTVNLIGSYEAEYRIGRGRDSSPPYAEDTDDWFKARIQRGWSDKLTSQENTIEDALWLAKCRCKKDYCEDRKSCPQPDERIMVEGGDCGEDVLHLDMDFARKLLAEKGEVNLGHMSILVTGDGPAFKVNCSFEKKDMNLFDICKEVEETIRGEVYILGYFGACLIPSHFQKSYGISELISSKRFIRSLFLVLTKAPGIGMKKARLTPMQGEVTVSKIFTHVPTFDLSWVFDGNTENIRHYEHRKTIYRFFSAANEPIELVLDGTFIARHNDYQSKYIDLTWRN